MIAAGRRMSEHERYDIENADILFTDVWAEEEADRSTCASCGAVLSDGMLLCVSCGAPAPVCVGSCGACGLPVCVRPAGP